MRLLLVEDEAAIASRTRESLEEAHYSVDWARDGVEALALAREREYAAIILDLMLPGVDGWEVCETLRRRRDPTSILMLTARGALEDRIRSPVASMCAR
jgi:two-component system copper resistance phosphate regulon response regulator CusR